MVVKSSPALLLALTTAVAGLAASPAQARDRPGTPNKVVARLVDTDSITLSWQNTTRWVDSICFDFEVRDSAGGCSTKLGSDWQATRSGLTGPAPRRCFAPILTCPRA